MAYVHTGKRIGIEKGLKQGRQEGRQEGRRTEAANLLLILLRSRFAPVPAELAEQVQVAGADVIEMWFQRAITAPSLAAVFGDVAPHSH